METLTAVVLALTTLRDRVQVLAGEQWFCLPVAMVPLAAAFVGELTPAWLRRRRQNRITHVVEEKRGDTFPDRLFQGRKRTRKAPV